MRVEGENGGANPPLPTSFCNGVENSLMSEMETIKVADGQNAGAVVRRIGQMGNHFHRVMNLAHQTERYSNAPMFPSLSQGNNIQGESSGCRGGL